MFDVAEQMNATVHSQGSCLRMRSPGYRATISATRLSRQISSYYRADVVVEAEIRTQQAVQDFQVCPVTGGAILHAFGVLTNVDEPSAQYARIPAVLQALPAVACPLSRLSARSKGWSIASCTVGSGAANPLPAPEPRH